MIPEVTVTLTVPADRLAELGAFCQEVAPPVLVDVKSAPENSDEKPLAELPPAPKKKRGRPAGAKNKPKPDATPASVEGTKAHANAAAALSHVEPGAPDDIEKEKTPLLVPSIDDVRAAITAAAEAGKVDAIKKLMIRLGVGDVSSIPEEERAGAIAELQAA